MPTLEFSGKPIVYAHHFGVPFRPLVPDFGKSVLLKGQGGKKGAVLEDSNLLIHGDNLHALKALMPRYAGRVNCVCIDPPYNTGNEGWAYNDNVNSPLMRRWLAENGVVDGDDMERHDKWLCMMWPRLQLLHELLADDGVIFISIDGKRAAPLDAGDGGNFWRGKSSRHAGLGGARRQGRHEPRIRPKSRIHFMLCQGP